MILSPTGKIVADEIKNIPTYHPRIVLDEWVVIPNHIHLIIELKNYEHDNHMTVKPIKNNDGNERDERNGRNEPNKNDIKQYRKFRRKMVIPKIIGKMKMVSSKKINILNQTSGHKNWQSNYHDHVIRNQKSYFNIKKYIISNPKNGNRDNFFN